MADDEQKETGEAILDAIPLVVADESKPPPPPRRPFAVPRIVDYIVVAAFMYFLI